MFKYKDAIGLARSRLQDISAVLQWKSDAKNAGGGRGWAGEREGGLPLVKPANSSPLIMSRHGHDKRTWWLALERNVRNGGEQWEADLFTGYQ